jgi:hypothetical protein
VPTPLPVHPLLGPTPLPVHVADPSNWYLTYAVPVIGTVAAVIAAVAAVIALRGLISANESLRIAKEQARAADAERSKRPVLSVHAASEQLGRVTVVTHDDVFLLSFAVFNAGDRTATDVSVDFVFDGWIDIAARFIGSGERPIPFNAHGFTSATINGSVTPGNSCRIGYIQAVASPGIYSVQWLVRSSEGLWPLGSRFGAIEVTVRKA